MQLQNEGIGSDETDTTKKVEIFQEDIHAWRLPPIAAMLLLAGVVLYIDCTAESSVTQSREPMPDQGQSKLTEIIALIVLAKIAPPSLLSCAQSVCKAVATSILANDFAA